MIRPDMATLLAFVVTDAAVAPMVLAQLTRRAADRSFNRITVDGDMSTNDSFVWLRPGNGRTADRQPRDPRCAQLEGASATSRMNWRWRSCATAKGQQVHSDHGRTAQGEREAATVAYAVAHSPLVKTAMFASDPNLGRILSASVPPHRRPGTPRACSFT